MSAELPFDQHLPRALACLDQDDVEAHPGPALVALARWGRSRGWPCEVIKGDLRSGNTDYMCLFLECDGFMLDSAGNTKLGKIVGRVRRILGIDASLRYHYRGEPQDIVGTPPWMDAQGARYCAQMLSVLQAQDLAEATAPVPTQAPARRL